MKFLNKNIVTRRQPNVQSPEPVKDYCKLPEFSFFMPPRSKICLLYTSDAADDMQCVDLGGRRIIKKDIV